MCFLWGTNWILIFYPHSVARSQFASGRSCDWPIWWRFSVVSSVLEQMLSWYPNFTLHCMLHMQPSQCQIKFHYNAAHSRHIKIIQIVCITSTTRTSGHCLGTFKIGDIVSCSPLKCSVSHYLLPLFSLLFLFSLSLSLSCRRWDKCGAYSEIPTPSSPRTGGPIWKHVNCLVRNKNLIVCPNGTQNQECLCWRRPATNYYSALVMLKANAK
jgi:hypothetical protein